MEENIQTQKPIRFVRIAYFAFLALSVLLAVLRTLCYAICFNGDLNYFNDGPLPMIFHIALGIALLLSACSLFLFPKNVPLPQNLPSTLLTQAAAIPLTAFVLLSLGFLLIFVQSVGIGTITLLLCMVSAFPTAGYFLLSARNKHADFVTFCGFGAVLWCALTAATEYFDNYMEMNSPVKLLSQFTMLVFMLYLLQEMRFRLETQKPRLWFTLCMAAMLMSASASLPILIPFFRGDLPMNQYVVNGITCFGIWLYLAARGWAFVNQYGKNEPAEENSTEVDNTTQTSI